MQPIFALTTRGLETASAAELSALAGITVGEIAYRRISATSAGDLAPLLRLRTVDDVYLDLATWEGIGHTRDLLAVFQWYGTQLDLESAATTIAALRPVAHDPLFSITASFVGRRNYSSDEIKLNVAAGIRERLGWHYSADDRAADFNVRVFIEHERAFVGVRLSKNPLHERAYKIAQRPGSLKPSVAAALLTLADVQLGQRLLDPCCGAGTILIEAALVGVTARGGDLDAEAVEAANANTQVAGLHPVIARWDARRLPLPDQSVDRIVTNLPWGRQIALDAGLYTAISQEMERVLIPGGRVALLTNTPELLRFERLQPIRTVEISLFGQTPMISIFG